MSRNMFVPFFGEVLVKHGPKKCTLYYFLIAVYYVSAFTSQLKICDAHGEIL